MARREDLHEAKVIVDLVLSNKNPSEFEEQLDVDIRDLIGGRRLYAEAKDNFNGKYNKVKRALAEVIINNYVIDEIVYETFCGLLKINEEQAYEYLWSMLE